MNTRLPAPPKPQGLLKWAFHLPRSLYRWHLGWMLGHLCLMITHVGRKTGSLRQTVLEVAHFDPTTQECIVMSGYGTQSDWYRNIQVHPATEVQVGRQRYTPQQRMLEAQETLHILQEYQRHHPWRFRELMHLAGYSYDGTPEALRAISQALRGVAFRP
ncbi:MAG: nitroreductase family deazaflavin-dependent oxidoreductase [Ktedonobacteraceae bacterium]